MKIVICYDWRDKSNTVFVWNSQFNEIEINDSIINNVLNSKIKINHLPSEDFAKNINQLFENEGRLILEGDTQVLTAIAKYIRKEAESYTRNLIEKQNLNKADRYWIQSDYKNFIGIMNEMDMSRVPKSYQLKYGIACRKINNLQ